MIWQFFGTFLLIITLIQSALKKLKYLDWHNLTLITNKNGRMRNKKNHENVDGNVSTENTMKQTYYLVNFIVILSTVLWLIDDKISWSDKKQPVGSWYNSTCSASDRFLKLNAAKSTGRAVSLRFAPAAAPFIACESTAEFWSEPRRHSATTWSFMRTKQSNRVWSLWNCIVV